MLSVSAPGTVPADSSHDAAAIARVANDFVAGLVAENPGRFGMTATVPLPDVAAATREAVRALDGLHADGPIMLANAGGTYLGSGGQDDLFAELDARRCSRSSGRAARSGRAGCRSIRCRLPTRHHASRVVQCA